MLKDFAVEAAKSDWFSQLLTLTLDWRSVAGSVAGILCMTILIWGILWPLSHVATSSDPLFKPVRRSFFGIFAFLIAWFIGLFGTASLLAAAGAPVWAFPSLVFLCWFACSFWMDEQRLRLEEAEVGTAAVG